MNKIEQTDAIKVGKEWHTIESILYMLNSEQNNGRTHVRITHAEDGVRFETGKEKEIITKPIYPPIPDNNHDWEAYYDGWDIGDPIGYGATEQEAINDLKDKEHE